MKGCLWFFLVLLLLLAACAGGLFYLIQCRPDVLATTLLTSEQPLAVAPVEYTPKEESQVVAKLDGLAVDSGKSENRRTSSGSTKIEKKSPVTVGMREVNILLSKQLSGTPWRGNTEVVLNAGRLQVRSSVKITSEMLAMLPPDTRRFAEAYGLASAQGRYLNLIGEMQIAQVNGVPHLVTSKVNFNGRSLPATLVNKIFPCLPVSGLMPQLQYVKTARLEGGQIVLDR